MCRPRSFRAVRLSLPTSILLASVIIALGLYLGLRTPTAGVAPPPATAAAPPQPQTGPTPSPPPTFPTAEQTAAHVTAVVVEAHPKWKAACWDPADPTTRKAGRYTAALAFDATGKLTISGVGEVRGESDSGIGQCLRQQVNTFTIPAPGHPVSFDVPFTMP